MLNRKVKKLIRDPKLFISDMIKNKKNKKNLMEKVKNGHYEYTVVSAVYNVGRYLEQYFKSLTTQRLDFKNNIYLILVDDGSTDNSAEIIKKWQSKYPNNIQYISKLNGGQASARNLGLQHVKTEWVTFIDPDDFVDNNYFLSVDHFAEEKKNQDIKLISCNFIFYFDDVKLFKDTHPLKYRFSKGDQLIPITNMGKHVQLSVNSVLFKTTIIQENEITFDEEIKPNYEDAEFITKYLFPLRSGNIAFLKSAKYFYRKRSDGTSTLDKAWEKPGLYDVVLQKGCIDSMRKYLDSGKDIPESLQIKILYHLFWYLKRYINNREKLSFLTDVEIRKFEDQVHTIFSMIDEKVILQFSLAGCWFYHKVGMLGCFKNSDPAFQIVYVESYDTIKELVQLRYFSRKQELESVLVNGIDITPSFTKTIRHDFLGNNFVNERRLWVKLHSSSLIKVEISGKNASISLAAKQEKNGLRGTTIVEHFKKMTPIYPINLAYKNAWLLMDRDSCADDNAEHLYRFLQKNKPGINIFFALRKESNDWERLKSEGFNLLDFGSNEHISVLQNCSKVISSHADYCVTNFLGPKMLHNRHFVFLQHGVIKDDLSRWLNSKDNIDCFITASKPEFDSIISNNSGYKYSKKEVVLTGLPRHDSLVSNINLDARTILIMPTWRSNIVGDPNKSGSLREINKSFKDTEYFRHWSSIIHSEKLRAFSEKYNYKVLFLPHINILPYIELFETPEFIELAKNRKIQEVFSNSSLLITDYSSVAFDMAVQSKPTLYYQFDEDQIFNGSHTYSKGYFDYRKDGFGNVATDEEDFFIFLEEMLCNDAKTTELIQDRINSTLTLRDGNSCKRVLEAILALDRPLPEEFFDLDVEIEYAEKALSENDWKLALHRWSKIFNIAQCDIKERAKIEILKSLNHIGDTNAAIDFLEKDLGLDFNNPYIKIPDELLRECAKSYTNVLHWTKSLKIIDMIATPTEEDILISMRCYAENNNYLMFEKLASQDMLFSTESLILRDAWYLMSKGDWSASYKIIQKNISILVINDFIKFNAYLILAKASMNLEDFTSSKENLDKISTDCKIKYDLKLYHAQLTFLQKDWNKTIEILSKEFQNSHLIPDSLKLIYIKALRSQRKYSEAASFICNSDIAFYDNKDVKYELAEIHTSLGQWTDATKLWTDLLDYSDVSYFRLARACRMNGQIDQALLLIMDTNKRPPQNINDWILRAELCQLCLKWDEACESWLAILRDFSEEAPKDSWSRLNNAQLMKAVMELRSPNFASS